MSFIKNVSSSFCLFFLLGTAILISSCSSTASLLNKIPINKMYVKVIDQHDKPVKGALVEATNGRKSTTNKKGIAKIKFGSVGIHNITVVADRFMPSNFVITMPAARGKTITRRLTGEIELASVNIGALNMYPVIFNYILSSYGYSPQLKNYTPGQQTTWQMNSGDGNESMTASRAYLKKLDNGKQWWRITFDKGGDDDEDYTAEVLFSKDRSEILRYREKIGDGKVKEKPISEGTYSKPVELTEDSEKGAVKKKNVSIEVPKGTFSADMLQFGVAPKTNLNIWRTNDSSVPGGVVKYEVRDEDGKIYSNELKDYSSNATTNLDSY